MFSKSTDLNIRPQKIIIENNDLNVSMCLCVKIWFEGCSYYFVCIGKCIEMCKQVVSPTGSLLRYFRIFKSDLLVTATYDTYGQFIYRLEIIFLRHFSTWQVLFSFAAIFLMSLLTNEANVKDHCHSLHFSSSLKSFLRASIPLFSIFISPFWLRRVPFCFLYIITILFSHFLAFSLQFIFLFLFSFTSLFSLFLLSIHIPFFARVFLSSLFIGSSFTR